MKQSEIIRTAYLRVTFASIALAATSCDSNSRENGDSCGGHEGSTNAAVVVKIREKPSGPTREERFRAEFKQLVVLKRSKKGEKSTWKIINELCNEICALPKSQAVPLLDEFVDMAISQPVTETDYNLRQAWFEQLFYVIHDAFCFAQGLQKESFEHWERLFSFFNKYTDEITVVEKTLLLTDSRLGAGTNKRRYLRGIRDDLRRWVHVLRDFYFPELSEGLTEEQKADILRRFKEVEKFTVPQSHNK